MRGDRPLATSIYPQQPSTPSVIQQLMQEVLKAHKLTTPEAWELLAEKVLENAHDTRLPLHQVLKSAQGCIDQAVKLRRVQRVREQEADAEAHPLEAARAFMDSLQLVEGTAGAEAFDGERAGESGPDDAAYPHGWDDADPPA